MQPRSPHDLFSPHLNKPLPSSLAPVSVSPSISRGTSYQQPLGTGAQARSHVGEKLTRLVECDLVLDNVEVDRNGQWLLPENLRTFILSLGPVASSHYYGYRPPTSEVKPSTPRKAGRIDPISVRNSLKELWMTEESYKLKISSLLQHFAKPLRSFAISEITRVIDAWSAKKLFINIEQLVPVSVAFADDLREIVVEMEKSERKEGKCGEVPKGFGKKILDHVQNMGPYKTWLASYELARQTRVELETTNKEFMKFVRGIELSSKEYANTTVGFRDILAEPHQRVARYGLMIDPMIRHLPPNDENVPYLEEALEVLNEICAMEVDEQTTKAAVMWALVQSIDKFPAQLINSSRYFIYSIDVDELIDQNTSLRVTLFLFNDLVLIVKRPNGRETGRSLAGLDDIPSLMSLYSTSSLPGGSVGPSSMSGSPRKTKKKELGYRGHALLHELYLVDLGGSSFGFFLESPPNDIPKGERWNGRHERRFEIARHAYPNDVREVEKDVFVQKVLSARADVRSKKGLGECRVGPREGSEDDGFRIYWQVCERGSWERIDGAWKNRLALQLDNSGVASDISFDREGRLQVASRLKMNRDQSALFSVRSRNRQEGEPEIISLERVSVVVDRIASNYGLTEFPAGTSRPSTPGGSGRGRKRPLSFMGVVNALGNGLKRTQSTNSKASYATSSGVGGWGTPVSNSNSESDAHDGASSPDHFISPTSHSNWMLNPINLAPESCNFVPDPSAVASDQLNLASDPSNLALDMRANDSSAEMALVSPCLPLSPRRRPMGPRNMGSRPKTPSGVPPAHPPSPLVPFERESSPTVSPAIVKLSPPTGKRPMIEVSPRAAPAKKVAALNDDQAPRRPSTNESKPRVSSGASRRNTSSGYGRRSGKRIVSSTSTIRAPLSDLASASMPADVFDAAHDDEMILAQVDDNNAPPLDRLSARLLILSNQIAALASERENRPVQAGLSRSPSTRNLKSIAAESKGTFAHTVIMNRRISNLDLSDLLHHFDEMSDLVKQCRSGSQTEVLPASLPTEAEFETLTLEREMMQEDLKLLRERYSDACTENARQQEEVAHWSSRYKTLHDAWKALGQEIETLYSTFSGEIKAVEEIYQAEDGTARTRALELGMADAIAERSQAQQEVARLRQELATERAERADLERQLRITHQMHA